MTAYKYFLLYVDSLGNTKTLVGDEPFALHYNNSLGRLKIFIEDPNVALCGPRGPPDAVSDVTHAEGRDEAMLQAEQRKMFISEKSALETPREKGRFAAGKREKGRLAASKREK